MKNLQGLCISTQLVRGFAPSCYGKGIFRVIWSELKGISLKKDMIGGIAVEMESFFPLNKEFFQTLFAQF